MRPAEPLLELPPGEVSLGTGLRVITSNYAICRRTADSLSTLQEWVKERIAK